VTRRACWMILMTAAFSFFAVATSAQDVRKLVTITTPAKIGGVSVCGTSGLAAGLVHGGSIDIWRLPSGEVVSSWKTGEGVTSLACSFDGKWVAFGKRDGSVEIADAAGKPVRTLAVAHERINDVEYAPDGSLLAVSVSGRPAQLWNPATGLLVAKLETDFSGSTGMAFSPDNSLFATSDGDTTVRIYDRTGKLKAKYAGLLLEPFAISFLPDGKQVLVGGADCTLTFLDATNGSIVRELPKQSDPIFYTAALPGGYSVLSLHIDAATLGKYTVVLWNLGTNERRELAVNGKNLVGYGEIANHQPVLFTADSDSSLTAWEITQ
jgi:WD40 repeat protein